MRRGDFVLVHVSGLAFRLAQPRIARIWRIARIFFGDRGTKRPGNSFTPSPIVDAQGFSTTKHAGLVSLHKLDRVNKFSRWAIAKLFNWKRIAPLPDSHVQMRNVVPALIIHRNEVTNHLTSHDPLAL